LTLKPDITIKENSLIARLAAWKMQSHAVALVLGNTIHLHHITTNGFLKNERLVKHEYCHVRQYREHGYLPFLLKYTWEWMRKGYYNNRFEVEARAAENQPFPGAGHWPFPP